MRAGLPGGHAVGQPAGGKASTLHPSKSPRAISSCIPRARGCPSVGGYYPAPELCQRVLHGLSRAKGCPMLLLPLICSLGFPSELHAFRITRREKPVGQRGPQSCQRLMAEKQLIQGVMKAGQGNSSSCESRGRRASTSLCAARAHPQVWPEGASATKINSPSPRAADIKHL